RLDAGNAIRHHDVTPSVEFLRVEALPPLALAVGLRQLRRVIAQASLRPFGIVPVSNLEPVPRVSRVVADAEAQAVGARDFGPRPDDVFLRADVDRVPGVVL